MNWIVTADGHEADLLRTTPEDFQIARVAHALAQINRFGGHAKRPYSVAEHSLLVCDIAERYLCLDAHGLMAALMHDAHEALIGDVTSPLKAALGSSWARVEGRAEHMCATSFGYHGALTQNRADVHTADLMALAIERHGLLPCKKPDGQASTPWPCLAAAPVVTDYDLMSDGRLTMQWHEWRDLFIEKFLELQFARAETDAARQLEHRA